MLYGKKTVTNLLNKKDKVAKKHKYEQSKYVGTYSFNCPPIANHYILRECFGEGTTKMFEGIEVNVPVNYDAYLTRLYGDYMKLPPEEKRVAHHYNEGVDLNKSYKEYIKKI